MNDLRPYRRPLLERLESHIELILIFGCVFIIVECILILIITESIR